MALIATVALTAIKVGAAAVSGSVSVLSEAIHSALDLVSAALSFYTVREAIKPADEDHPFGHGKIETLSSLFEAVLLAIAAGFIVYEGVDHLRNPHEIVGQEWAIGVIFVSLVVSYIVYRHNLKAGRETESSALEVNALHFLSDVVASAGVLIGLVALKITGWLWIDPLVAFLVAAYVFAIALQQVKKSLAELSDVKLPESEVALVREILERVRDREVEVHDLRTRRSGAVRHIDFHLVCCAHLSVLESHEVCDHLEAEILTQFPGASIQIHVEPCVQERPNCESTCPRAKRSVPWVPR